MFELSDIKDTWFRSLEFREALHEARASTWGRLESFLDVVEKKRILEDVYNRLSDTAFKYAGLIQGQMNFKSWDSFCLNDQWSGFSRVKNPIHNARGGKTQVSIYGGDLQIFEERTAQAYEVRFHRSKSSMIEMFKYELGDEPQEGDVPLFQLPTCTADYEEIRDFSEENFEKGIVFLEWFLSMFEKDTEQK